MSLRQFPTLESGQQDLHYTCLHRFMVSNMIDQIED